MNIMDPIVYRTLFLKFSPATPRGVFFSYLTHFLVYHEVKSISNEILGIEAK